MVIRVVPLSMATAELKECMKGCFNGITLIEETVDFFTWSILLYQNLLLLLLTEITNTPSLKWMNQLSLIKVLWCSNYKILFSVGYNWHILISILLLSVPDACLSLILLVFSFWEDFILNSPAFSLRFNKIGCLIINKF